MRSNVSFPLFERDSGIFGFLLFCFLIEFLPHLEEVRCLLRPRSKIADWYTTGHHSFKNEARN